MSFWAGNRQPDLATLFTKDHGQRRYSNYPNAVPFIESQEGEGIQAIHFKLHPQL